MNYPGFRDNDGFNYLNRSLIIYHLLSRYQILEVPANLARGVVLALAKDFALDITSQAKVAQLKGKEAQIDVIIPTAIHSQNNNNLPIKHLDNEELQRRQNKFQVEQSKNKKKAMLPKHTNEEDNKQEPKTNMHILRQVLSPPPPPTPVFG